MKKSILVAASAVVLLSPFDARANSSDSVEIEIKGTVQAVCVMPDPTPNGHTNATIASDNVTIDNLIDQQTSLVQAWEANFTISQAMCNDVSTFTIESENGGLLPTEAVPDAITGEFLKETHYTISAKWGNAPSLELNTATQGKGPARLNLSGANKADILVKFVGQTSGTPLSKGEYRDRVYLNLTPAY